MRRHHSHQTTQCLLQLAKIATDTLPLLCERVDDLRVCHFFLHIVLCKLQES